MLLAAVLGGSPARSAEDAWLLETWATPFDYTSASREIRYDPLSHATRKWRICASYPHLKDSYWRSSPLKKASLTGFHAMAKHIAAKAVSPSSETMRTI